MTVARSVDDVLTEHVRFQVECIDRMFLNVYVPQLQYPAGLVGYVHRRLGLPIASTAPLAKITDAFCAAVHRFARDNAIPWVDFVKGQRKDDVMHEHLARFTGSEGVLFVGRAQEKTKLFRTEKRRDTNGDSYPWIVQTTGLVNHFYFYCYDDDFGPFFVKFCSYFPYNAKVCINGNHWAQRQAAKAGIGFTALDNGFAAVDDVDRLQWICDSLGPEQIDALLRKWLAILASVPRGRPDRGLPLRPVDPAGRVLPHADARQTGLRADVLRTGHPGQPRHRPPGPGGTGLRPAADPTRTSTHPGTVPHPGDHRGRDPQPARRLQAHPDQAVPQGRKALRTETTVNDTTDFSIGKRLTNLPALREIGFSANRRLLHVQRLSHDPITGTNALAAITGAVTTATGTRVPGLRFAERRSHALLQALLAFRCHPNGFANKDLRALTSELRGLDPAAVTVAQTTYDLRRLESRDLITRIPGTHRYQVTDHGLDTAKFLTTVHDRILPTGLAELGAADPTPGQLKAAAAAYRKAVDTLTATAQFAA